MSHPQAEIRVDAATVRYLLKAECPQFADQPIRLVDEGWDNFTFLVGARHAVRLPRRTLAVQLLVNEQRCLPLLAPRLSVEVPVPVHVGKPSDLFPWPWSVVRWIEGLTAENHAFHDDDIALLAETLRQLHQPAPDDAPINSHRGVPIATKRPVFDQRVDRLVRPKIDVAQLAAVWREACAAPAADKRVWLHGDLHPRNVIVRNGSLVGLIDWGDLSGGDAATDLDCAWLLNLSAPHRRELLAAYGADEALVCRAKGWAILVGLALLESGEPRHTPLGLAALERVIADS